MSKMKMRLPRSVATSLRRSGITRTPLGQARPRAETTVTQSAGMWMPGAVILLVTVLITLTALLLRSGKYRLRRAASKERMSEPSAVAGVQPGTTARPTNWTLVAAGTVAWSSTLARASAGAAKSASAGLAASAASVLDVSGNTISAAGRVGSAASVLTESGVREGARGRDARDAGGGPASKASAVKSGSSNDDRRPRPAGRVLVPERRIPMVPPPRASGIFARPDKRRRGSAVTHPV